MTVCGTGSGNFPQPGDPDLNSQILSAQAGEGGIAVSWTYPALLPQAVAHTLVFRGTANDFDVSALIRTIAGDYYFDRTDVVIGTTYYYWIKIVSVNGTIGDLIGPVSATMQPSVEQQIALMEGQIRESSLTTTLKTRIDEIDNVAQDLLDEINNRSTSDNAFSTLLADAVSDLAAVDTLVANEIVARTSGDSAIVTQVDAIAAVSGDNAAAIVTESLVRASADETIALGVTVLSASHDNTAASLVSEISTRASEDSAIASSVTALSSTVGSNTSAIEVSQTVTDGLIAEYAVRLDVNGYVVGYGILNNGDEKSTSVGGSARSAFIINADSFALMKPAGADGQEEIPFIIDVVNGVTKIALNAPTMIPDATIVNAMIGNYIQSTNYDGVGAGWKIAKDGDGEFNDIYARGNIEATSLKSTSLEIVETGHIKDLAVDTLQIAGTAVTVQSVGTQSGTTSVTSGTTSYVTIATVTVATEYGGYLATSSCQCDLLDDSKVTFRLVIGGVEVRVWACGGRADNGSDVALEMTSAMNYAAASTIYNSITATLQVKYASGGGTTISNGVVAFDGAKK